MRRFALLLFVTLPLFGDVYEIHSTRYLLAVEVANEHYDVSVTDLDGRVVIASERLGRSEDQVTAAIEASDSRRLLLRIHERDRRINAELRVERRGMVLDVLHATWLTEPYVPQLEGPGPYRVGGAVRAPVVMKRVEPVYTEEAKAARVSGIVILEVVIDRTGRVTDAKVLKPMPFGLDQTAVDAVRQWEFRPGTVDGDPVDVIFNLTVSFKLEN